MKLVNSTLFALFLCIYSSAQSGNLDGTFNSSGTPGYISTNVVSGGDDFAQAMAVQSDGKIVVAAYNENNYITILRYTTSGTLDGSFGTGGIVTLRNAFGDDAQAFAISVLSDNKILVAGYSWGSTKDFALVRLEENGNPDVTFGTNGWAITPVGSGDDEARTIAVQSNGQIVVAGISNNGSNNDFALVRYNADGSLDNLFGTGGTVSTNINGNDLVESMAIQSDGKIVVGGTSNSTGDADFAVVRYNSDGSLDNSGPGFGTGGIVTVDIGLGGAGSTDLAHTLAIQSDGKIILAGQTAASGGGNDDIAIIRLTPDGVLDAGPSGFDGDGVLTFNYGTVNTDEEIRGIIVQGDGKILVAGSTDGAGSSYSLLMLRYNADGSLDPTFGPGADGIVTADVTSRADFGYAIALHGNRIYVAGSTSNGSDKQVILSAFVNNYTTLPLTLLQFYGEKQNSKVVLHWQTTAEENVRQFIVESSSDSKTFKAIGYVLATGNKNNIANYSFIDQLPLSSNNYYRLLIQDFDGGHKYSKVVNVKYETATNVQLYPCPAKDVVNIQLPEGLRGTITLQIIDLQGRLIKTNSFSSNGNALSVPLDIQYLPNGMYMVEVRTGRTSVTNHFIKQ